MNCDKWPSLEKCFGTDFVQKSKKKNRFSPEKHETFNKIHPVPGSHTKTLAPETIVGPLRCNERLENEL